MKMKSKNRKKKKRQIAKTPRTKAKRTNKRQSTIQENARNQKPEKHQLGGETQQHDDGNWTDGSTVTEQMTGLKIQTKLTRGWDAGKRRSGKWQSLEVGEGFMQCRCVGTADWRSGNRAGLIKRDDQAGEEHKKKTEGKRNTGNVLCCFVF